MANGTLDELLIGLGFDYDPEDLEKFQSQIDGTVDLVKKLAKAAVAGATAITAITIASTRATDEMGKFADEIGETVEMVDALQFANRRAGGSVDGMSNSLRELSLRAGEAARGVGSGLEAFGLLGIEVTDVNGAVRQSSDLILEVSQRLQQFERSRQIELADKLGLRDSLRLLQRGPSAIRELTNEAMALGTATDQDAALAANFQDSLIDLWQITKQLSRLLSRSVAPILEKTNDLITEWWKANKDLIEQNLPKWIDSVIKGLKIVSLLLGVFFISKIATATLAFVKFAAAMRVAAGTSVLLQGALALLPITITAAILLLVGAIEDAKTFFEGGDSLIGELIGDFPQFEKELKGVATVLNDIWRLTELIIEGWKNIFELIGFAISKLPKLRFGTPEDLRQGRAAREARSGFSFGGLLDVFSGFSAVPQQFGIPETNGGIPETNGGIPETNGGNQITNSSRRNLQIDQINITVPGAGNPSAVAIAVQREFHRMLQQADQDLDTPVDQ